MWIDFGVSVVFFLLIICFHFWSRNIGEDKSVTIRNFALELNSLTTEGRDKGQEYLYNNQKFLDVRRRKEPHSVHTFYKKKTIKGHDYFFGKKFRETLHNFDTLESYSSIRTLKSRQSVERPEPGSSARKVVVTMDQESRRMLPENNLNSFNVMDSKVEDKSKESNTEGNQDLDFGKLKELLRKDFQKEEMIRYFRSFWNVEVKNVKFVYDFKETLPNLISISKNSYMLCKMKDRARR